MDIDVMLASGLSHVELEMQEFSRAFGSLFIWCCNGDGIYSSNSFHNSLSMIRTKPERVEKYPTQFLHIWAVPHTPCSIVYTA